MEEGRLRMSEKATSYADLLLEIEPRPNLVNFAAT